MSTMTDVKVRNMVSNSSGREVANQFLIRTPEGEYFQSYDTIIALIDIDGRVYLDKDKWDYSTTTGKYRNQFLGESITDTRRKIKDGVYSLTDLNK